MRCLQYLFHHLHQEIHSRSSATYLCFSKTKPHPWWGWKLFGSPCTKYEVFWWLSAITYQANSVYILIQFPGAHSQQSFMYLHLDLQIMYRARIFQDSRAQLRVIVRGRAPESEKSLKELFKFHKSYKGIRYLSSTFVRSLRFETWNSLGEVHSIAKMRCSIVLDHGLVSNL